MTNYVDCGDCPRISTGCVEGRCLKGEQLIAAETVPELEQRWDRLFRQMGFSIIPQGDARRVEKENLVLDVDRYAIVEEYTSPTTPKHYEQISELLEKVYHV